MTMVAKKFFDEDEILDVDPVGEYESSGDEDDS